MTEAEIENYLNNPVHDYKAQKSEMPGPDYNLDANKREIKKGSLVRLSQRGRIKSLYNSSPMYDNLKTLRGTVREVRSNGEVRVYFEDLEGDANGTMRICKHDWLVVES